MTCTRRVHFHRNAEPETCADGQLRYVCFCGQVRFLASAVVPGAVDAA